MLRPDMAPALSIPLTHSLCHVTPNPQELATSLLTPEPLGARAAQPGSANGELALLDVLVTVGDGCGGG